MRRLFFIFVIIVLFGTVVMNIIYLRKISQYMNIQTKSLLQREEENSFDEFKDKVLKMLERIEKKLKKK